MLEARGPRRVGLRLLAVLSASGPGPWLAGVGAGRASRRRRARTPAQRPRSRPRARLGLRRRGRRSRLHPSLDDVRAQALDIALVVAFTVLAFVSFFRKSKPLKYVTLVASVAYIGFYKSTLMSIVNVFGLFGGNLPIFRYNLAWYLLAIDHARLDRAVGPRLLRAHLRLRRADAAARRASCPARLRVNVPRVLERRASLHQVRHPGLRPRLLPGHEGPADLPVHRAVLDVRHLRPLGADVDRPRPSCSSPRCSSATCTAGSCARWARSSACISHLTVFRIKRWSRVQPLPHLPEGVRVGRDPGAEDPADRMRALRRLRAAVRGHEEVPAPPDHHPEGRHPGPPRGSSRFPSHRRNVGLVSRWSLLVVST